MKLVRYILTNMNDNAAFLSVRHLVLSSWDTIQGRVILKKHLIRCAIILIIMAMLYQMYSVNNPYRAGLFTAKVSLDYADIFQRSRIGGIFSEQGTGYRPPDQF